MAVAASLFVTRNLQLSALALAGSVFVLHNLRLSVTRDLQDMSFDVPKSSKHATVMGMATNYGTNVYKRFVGSLRRSGFQGNIILAVSPVPKPGVEEYLISQNVTMKRLKLVNCSTNIIEKAGLGGQKVTGHDVEVMTCADPFPDLKARWGRFGLLRDYLKECQECTGPVLVADVRDTFFQRDPFGPEAPPVTGLQVFREHRVMRTTHWLAKAPGRLNLF